MTLHCLQRVAWRKVSEMARMENERIANTAGLTEEKATLEGMVALVRLLEREGCKGYGPGGRAESSLNPPLQTMGSKATTTQPVFLSLFSQLYLVDSGLCQGLEKRRTSAQ